MLPLTREPHSSISASVLYEILYAFEGVAIALAATAFILLFFCGCFLANAQRQGSLQAEESDTSATPLLPFGAPPSDRPQPAACAAPTRASTPSAALGWSTSRSDSPSEYRTPRSTARSAVTSTSEFQRPSGGVPSRGGRDVGGRPGVLIPTRPGSPIREK
jgi:hypothetical protein